jgi:hypothetical protein
MGEPDGWEARHRWPGGCWGQSAGTETSQYREGKKSTEMPLVVASERGGAQTAAAGSLPALSSRG